MQNSSRGSADARLSDVLSEFARTMATDFPIQAILDHLIGRIVGMLPISGAGVTLISPTMDPRYCSASDPSALRYEQLQTELREGPCLLAFHSDLAVQVPELRNENRFPRFGPSALRLGMRAVFTFPLRHGDHRLGALDLYRDSPGELSPTELTTAQTLADVAAAYLINAQARVDLQKSADRSRGLALQDALTGLPNRTSLLERLGHALERSRGTAKTSAVFLVDLDEFKAVNDTYGHAVGDQVLVAVADRLATLLRPLDTLARLHGDEFVLLCEDLDSPDQASTISARLAGALAKPFQLATVVLHISASVGIAFATADVSEPEQVLRDADLAMYDAKREGGGQLHVFDPRYRHIADGSGQLEEDLHGAVERGEMYTEYQPIVITATSEISGFETFVRWAHPSRGRLAPSTFISLAEHSGLIKDIGQWVLRQACLDLRSWQDKRSGQQAGLTMSVNVAPRELLATGFAERVARTLRAGTTCPPLLTLEVTESAFVHDSESVRTVLNDLKDIGVNIALDGFGTGACSLSHLSQFPIDSVKLDRSLTGDLGSDPVKLIIAGAVVQVAHALGMTVVAEGIETAEQHDQVRALGCDRSQGFYYGRPARAPARTIPIEANPTNSEPADVPVAERFLTGSTRYR